MAGVRPVSALGCLSWSHSEEITLTRRLARITRRGLARDPNPALARRADRAGARVGGTSASAPQTRVATPSPSQGVAATISTRTSSAATCRGSSARTCTVIKVSRASTSSTLTALDTSCAARIKRLAATGRLRRPSSPCGRDADGTEVLRPASVWALGIGLV